MDRNFFGSQIDSFETNLPCKIPGDENGPFRAIFIRAPAILSVGDGVEVLGEMAEPAVAAELALGSLRPRDVLVVTGSFFHLAEVRDRLVDRLDVSRRRDDAS